MKKGNSLISPEIQEILNSVNKTERIRESFEDMHSYDIFVLCEDLENFEVAECIKALGIPTGIELFEQFDDLQHLQHLDLLRYLENLQYLSDIRHPDSFKKLKDFGGLKNLEAFKQVDELGELENLGVLEMLELLRVIAEEEDSFSFGNSNRSGKSDEVGSYGFPDFLSVHLGFADHVISLCKSRDSPGRHEPVFFPSLLVTHYFQVDIHPLFVATVDIQQAANFPTQFQGG